MPRIPVGKPVKIIPMGDVPAALEWVGYAKKCAWELLGTQGTWKRKVIHPNADTTIRIETLAGIPRVTIEVAGIDYIVVASENYVYPLVGGKPYTSGKAKHLALTAQGYANISGSVFVDSGESSGAFLSSGLSFQRTARNGFVGDGRGVIGDDNYGFLVAKEPFSKPTAYYPWMQYQLTPYEVNHFHFLRIIPQGNYVQGNDTYPLGFISGSCYAGLNAAGHDVYHHLVMRYRFNQTTTPGMYDRFGSRGPAVITVTFDGTPPHGFSYTHNILYDAMPPDSPYYPPGYTGEIWPLLPAQAYGIEFLGDNHIVVFACLSKAIETNNGAHRVPGWDYDYTQSDMQPSDLLVRFTSSDNGATWTQHQKPVLRQQPSTIGDIALSFPGGYDSTAIQEVMESHIMSACYVGDGKTLGFTNVPYMYDRYDTSGFYTCLDWRWYLNVFISSDYGQTFTRIYRGRYEDITPDQPWPALLVGPRAARPICIGLGACGYISESSQFVADLINANSLNLQSYLSTDGIISARAPAFYRTLDFGHTWEEISLTSVVSHVGIASLTVIAADTSADAAKTRLMFLGRPVATDDVPNPGIHIIYSHDGGTTWHVGSKVSDISSFASSKPAYVKSLVPFPVFPDMHKNGLDIP